MPFGLPLAGFFSRYVTSSWRVSTPNLPRFRSKEGRHIWYMGYDRTVYIRYHFSCGLDRKDACWLSFTPLTGIEDWLRFVLKWVGSLGWKSRFLCDFVGFWPLGWKSGFFCDFVGFWPLGWKSGFFCDFVGFWPLGWKSGFFCDFVGFWPLGWKSAFFYDFVGFWPLGWKSGFFCDFVGFWPLGWMVFLCGQYSVVKSLISTRVWCI